MTYIIKNDKIQAHQVDVKLKGKKMTTGLTIMRLQPMHNMHKHIIDTMLQENDCVILVIGSINTSDERNPFTYAERFDMVYAVYESEINSGRLIVKGVADIHTPPKWVAYVQEQVGIPFNRYYCGQGQDAILFKEKNITVCEVIRLPESLSATRIRQKMKNDDSSWRYDVPPEVYNYIVNNHLLP